MEIDFVIKIATTILLIIGIYVFAYGVEEDNAVARIIGGTSLIGVLVILFNLIEKVGNYGG